MKRSRAPWFVLLLVASGPSIRADDGSKPNVIERVVKLMGELKDKIRQDGEDEQASYDKYACWCEETLGKKAADISTAKEAIDALQTEIEKLKGELATHNADIAQLKKDIAANVESQREATEVRDKEREGYEDDKNENEQCMGALEAAIKVLTGAGTVKKANLLATMQEAQLLSVVAGVRGLLAKPAVTKFVSSDDMQLVEKFVGHPEDFLRGRGGGLANAAHTGSGAVQPVSLGGGVLYPNELGGFLAAVQVGNNPFGDYAPQSDRISGILKGMYDTFARDIEKNNVEEADKQKAFEELMKTKQAEMDALQTTLDQQTMYAADKTKKLAESKADRDNTQEQLAADEKFFAQAKKSCKVKAGQWANRVRMRTEEMKGIDNAIDLLSGEESKGIFTNATESFLQVGSARQAEDAAVRETRNEAYRRLQSLAAQYQNVGIAKVAVALTTSGHFDDVIVSIDKMIAELRLEEKEDIEQKDRCENSQNDNAMTKEDLETDIKKLEDNLKRSGDAKDELEKDIKSTEDSMKDTEDEMADLQSERMDAETEFRQSIGDDTKAVELLGKAVEALSAYYKKNKMPLGLAQGAKRVLATLHRHGEEPVSEYTVDPEKAPETGWDGDYKGSSSEAGGLVAIIQMIKEDFEKEMVIARKEDVEAQKVYEADRAGLQEVLEKLTLKRNGMDKELADLKLKIAGMESTKEFKDTNLGLENEKETTLGDECGWVATHFEKRRTKRKAEMDGLVEAKNYLAGMDNAMAGSDQ